MKKVLAIVLCVITSICYASEESDRSILLKQLKHDFKLAFMEEVEKNYGKQLEHSGWSSNPVASLALVACADEIRRQNLSKLKSLKLARIYAIFTADATQYDIVRKNGVTHRVGVFDEQSDFPSVIFFNEPFYPATFRAFDALMQVAKVRK